MEKLDRLDEFESRFRAAEREGFVFEDVSINDITLVSDKPRGEAEATVAELKRFLPRLNTGCEWRVIGGEDYGTVAELLNLLDQQPSDLVVTYRHLQEESLVPQHSLGVYLDVLTQVSGTPVLLLPGTAGEPVSLAAEVCDRVLCVTDHISGDDRLINSGVRLCEQGGTVWLCHIEDDAVFERYMRAIERIPDIESQQARTLIDHRLLKDASDFIETCVEELRTRAPGMTFPSIVTRGHHLSEYRSIIDANSVDLIVTNTQDEGQLAMHGMAYALAVELVDTALLLL